MGVLGKYVKQRRQILQGKHAGYSIRKLAERMGVHHSYLSKLERGEYAPLSEGRIEALAREIGEQPEVLLALSGRLPERVSRLISADPGRFIQFLADLEQNAEAPAGGDSLLHRLERRKRELEEVARRLRDEAVLGRKARARREAELLLVLNRLQGVALLVVDVNHVLTWANDVAARYFRCAPDQAVGMKCHAAVYSRTAPCEGCDVTRAIATGRAQAGMIVTPDGRSWMTRSAPIMEADGLTGKVVQCRLDVTELVKAREAVQEGEERWRLALEAAEGRVWDWDVVTGLVAVWSDWPAMAQGGRRADEKSIFDLNAWLDQVHPDDRQAVLDGLTSLSSGDAGRLRTEYRLLGADGRYGRVQDRSRVVRRDAQGRPLRVLGVRFELGAGGTGPGDEAAG